MRKKTSKSVDTVTAAPGSKSLVIAEKPSVAQDLAKVLKVPKVGEIYENDQWVISSAIGHLVRLKDPQDIDPKFKRWTLKDLPILPEKFDGTVCDDILKVIEGERNDGSRYKLLKKLLLRKDVGSVVNACDAGREGELILHNIYTLTGRKLPLQRLWLTSMTNTSILASFANLLPESAKEGLRDSAVARSQADWLVGMNATRFSTIRIGGALRRESYSAGRVQTPTLMLIVERELEIRRFVPKTFWKIEANFNVAAGQYRGVAQVPGVADRKDAERFFEEAAGRKVAAETEQLGVGKVSDERKPKKESAPRLLDLTTLQREGNRRFGFSAKTTLSAAQRLYEHHKALTYPRTDSQYLPEDHVATAKEVMSSLVGGHSVGQHAREVLSKGWVDSAGKRVFDNKKVSDHFAIVPTGTIPHGLSDVEERIYDLVVRRFVAVFFPMAEFEETVRTTMVGPHNFRTTGKVLVVSGWRAVWGQEADAEEDKDKEGAANLPALSAADGNPAQAKLVDLNVKQDATKPPARYNEASLLGAMENAGKLVDDEALAEAMKERGLGTPATRAATIEELLSDNKKYIERQGKELVPLAKAFQLHQFIHKMKLSFLSEARLTGEWEYKLRLIEQGKLPVKQFIAEIKAQVKEMVELGGQEEAPTQVEPTVLSPSDGKPMLTNGESFFSQDRSEDGKKPMVLAYIGINGHTMTSQELAELVEKRRIGPFTDFKSMKSGKNFTGFIDLVDEDSIVSWKDKPAEKPPAPVEGEGAAKPKKAKAKKPTGRLKAVLFLAPREGVDGNPDAFDTDWPILGDCPVSGLPVQHTPTNGYRVCPQRAQAAGAKKTFSLNAEMLKAPITADDVRALLTQGKSPLKKFISKRTNRGFEAFLIADKEKGWWFAFPPRKPKGPKKGAVATDVPDENKPF
jgi:DNA topoisomerase-3